MSPQHTTTSCHQRSRILQQQDAQMSPRMLMRKQLREDPSGYHTEALHIEPKFSTEPEPVPTLQAKNVSKIEFYTLHSEIIQFQNLVRELESFLNKNNQTPEDHWRSRILLRSAEEADQDILIQIQQHSHRHFADPTVRASFGKLHCDFKRAHTTLRKILMKCKDRQGTDLSSLPTKRDTSTSLRQQRAVEEDFFDRTTREREREKLAKINTAMQQVHEIYNDLALLVTHQKEDGNQIEETIDCSNVVADLENQPLQRTKNRMARFACGGGGGSAYDEVLNRSHEYSLDPKNGSKRQRSGVLVCGDLDDSVSHNDATDTETDSSIQSSRYRRSSTKGKRRARRDSSSTTEEPGSSWIFSCNTIQNDFIDVQKDLLGFVVSDFIAKNTKDLLICGSSNDVAND